MTAPGATVDAARPAPAGGAWDGAWGRAGFALAAFALSRVVVLMAFGAAAYASGTPVREAFDVWDGGWYRIVAEDGYYDHVPVEDGRAMQSALAFFPGFPFTVRALSALTGLSTGVAGMAVVTGFAALAVVAMAELAHQVRGPEVARRSALLVSFFPGAFVFSLLYSEAMMLALAAGCLLALHRRRWLLAGLAAAAASAVRPNALVLTAACAWAAWAAWRHDGDRRAVVAPLLAPLGTLAFWGVVGHRVGDYGFWFRVQREGWDQSTDFGVGTVLKLFNLRNDYGGDTLQIISGVGFVFAVVALVWLARRPLPAPLTLYALGILAIAVSSSSQGARPRFVLTAFPLLFVVADRVRGERFAAVLALSAGALACLSAITVVGLVAEP